MTRSRPWPVSLMGIAALIAMSLSGCSDDGTSATPPDDILPPDGFVHVPAGTFSMGSPPDEQCRGSNEIRHVVTLTRGLYVSPTEVTQDEWLMTMGWNPSRFLSFERPVESVTWFDAISFCNRLSLARGLTPAYTITDTVFSGNHITDAAVTWEQTANGYRLLTEAEWEYACRAGSTTALCNNGHIYDCGCGEEPDLVPDLVLVGWYCGNSDGETQYVGLKAPNTWDLHDMHGNVWEWCWDWYGAYGSDPVEDPTGPPEGSVRVVRGGSWFSGAGQCRSASRHYYSPGYMDDATGLRIVRNAP